MKSRESTEDYLETVLILKNRMGRVRSIDIAAELGVSRASVCVAMRNLREAGLIHMDDDYEITLTDEGWEIAETMYERHLLFSELLESLGIDRRTASRDACRMEHAVSAESFAAIKAYLLRMGYALEDNREKDTMQS